jgi:hypothetical protein
MFNLFDLRVCANDRKSIILISNQKYKRERGYRNKIVIFYFSMCVCVCNFCILCNKQKEEQKKLLKIVN